MRTIVTLLIAALIAPSAELPVRQVILYKHGVGHFERSGKLGPGESARLDFKASEMNDVLKSLTVQERGGGRISGLRYDSMEPLDRKLAEFPFKLGESQSLSAVLDQLKGARIEVTVGGQAVAGAIVGGRLASGDDKRPEREQLTVLVDSGELRTVDLASASSIRFSEARLQQQFRDYLAALTAARSQDERSVYIDSTDGASREVSASYTIPAAVWKSSYRLLMDESGKPVLEGWAIIDNTTADDWVKVSLALVSGRPISFITQLYPPKYVNRPLAELPDDQAQGPVMHESAFAAGTGAVAELAAAPPPPAPMMAAKSASRARVAMAESRDMAAASSVAPAAATREMGDLFEYRLSQPVTIRKNESAMLPFLQQKVEARKLLIYLGQQQGSPHPTNAAEITNSSGKTLDGGPVTLYDGGGYAGEALMETLKAGDKRLISYAVDLGTRITERWDSKQEVVREVRASRGVLTTKSAVEETRTYTIRNVDQKAKKLIIEHAQRPGYTLLNQKPTEKTGSAYRFEVKLAPGAEAAFPVAEERVYETSFQAINLSSDVLMVYTRNKSISAAGRKQIEEVLNGKEQLAEAEQQLNDAKNQILAAAGDEDRLRKNIESLNRVSGQQQAVQEYARKVAVLETQLAGLRDRESELTRKRAVIQAEVNRMVAALAF